MRKILIAAKTQSKTYLMKPLCRAVIAVCSVSGVALSPMVIAQDSGALEEV
jgi:hypothetical protein